MGEPRVWDSGHPGRWGASPDYRRDAFGGGLCNTRFVD